MNPYLRNATTVNATRLVAFTSRVLRARAAADDGGCPVTVYANTARMEADLCDEPVAPGSRFCIKHEADRTRLGGES